MLFARCSWAMAWSDATGIRISRFGAGRAFWKPVVVPHHLSYSSAICCWAVDWTMWYGPVPHGQFFATSKLVKVFGFWLAQMCFGRMTWWFSWPRARLSRKNRGEGLVRLIWAVSGSTTVTSFRYSL